MPMISVVMPVYNEKDNLKKSIESILNQTYTDFEFLIVNEIDSNDGSGDIIKSYELTDNRVKLIQRTSGKKGVASSLNLGIQYATGKYIARMDADDYSYPERFEKQIAYMEKNPGIMLCGTNYRIVAPDRQTVIEVETDPERIKTLFIFRDVIAHPTVMFRREEFLNKGLIYNENEPAEDYELWCKAVNYGKFTNIPEVLLDYKFGYGTNLAPKMVKYAIEVCKRNLKEMLDFPLEKFPEEIYAFTFRQVDKGGQYLEAYLNFLTEIEMRNCEREVYPKDILAEILAGQWNDFLRGYIGFVKLPVYKRFLLECKNGFSKQIEEEYSGLNNMLAQLKEISDKLREEINIRRKVFIFGAGIVGKLFYNCHRDILEKRMLGWIDNNIGMQGKVVEGKKVFSFETAMDCCPDAIFIANSKHTEEIYNQIKEYDKCSSVGVYSIECLNL